MSGRSATPENPYRGLEAGSRDTLRDLLTTGVSWIEAPNHTQGRIIADSRIRTLQPRVNAPLSIIHHRDEHDDGIVIAMGV